MSFHVRIRRFRDRGAILLFDFLAFSIHREIFGFERFLIISHRQSPSLELFLHCGRGVPNLGDRIEQIGFRNAARLRPYFSCLASSTLSLLRSGIALFVRPAMATPSAHNVVAAALKPAPLALLTARGVIGSTGVDHGPHYPPGDSRQRKAQCNYDQCDLQPNHTANLPNDKLDPRSPRRRESVAPRASMPRCKKRCAPVSTSGRW